MALRVVARWRPAVVSWPPNTSTTTCMAEIRQQFGYKSQWHGPQPVTVGSSNLDETLKGVGKLLFH